MTLARLRSAMPLLNGSSAFRITVPSGPTASASAPFSLAIASRAPHEFDMRDADVGDDGDIRRGELRQRRDFARMIHPDLPDADFVVAKSPPASSAAGRRDY